MNPRVQTSRALVSGALVLVLAVLGVAVPLLERADAADSARVETPHAPGNCPTAHDHTVCAQVGANHAAAAGSGTLRLSWTRDSATGLPATEAPAVATAVVPPPARAPPVSLS